MRNVPPDYHARLEQIELEHWWPRGMRSIAVALLGDRLAHAGQSILDAGCGTGGFLRFAGGLGTFACLCGVDVSSEAIELARRRVPEADLHVASLDALPFEDQSFDLAVLNDVLQHVREAELDAGLAELRRTLRPAGALLVRTSGARRARRERGDWRAYDRGSLASELNQRGFRVERLTYANTALSLWAAALHRGPRAPSGERHGIPGPAGALASAVGSSMLGLEARYLARPGRSLPFGHTLLAVAVPDGAA